MIINLARSMARKPAGGVGANQACNTDQKLSDNHL